MEYGNISLCGNMGNNNQKEGIYLTCQVNQSYYKHYTDLVW